MKKLCKIPLPKIQDFRILWTELHNLHKPMAVIRPRKSWRHFYARSLRLAFRQPISSCHVLRGQLVCPGRKPKTSRPNHRWGYEPPEFLRLYNALCSGNGFAEGVRPMSHPAIPTPAVPKPYFPKDDNLNPLIQLPLSQTTVNTLLSVEDTLGGVTSVLAFMRHISPALMDERLSDAGREGHALILGMVENAVSHTMGVIGQVRSDKNGGKS